jgi:hypothetical protein
MTLIASILLANSAIGLTQHLEAAGGLGHVLMPIKIPAACSNVSCGNVR